MRNLHNFIGFILWGWGTVALFGYSFIENSAPFERFLLVTCIICYLSGAILMFNRELERKIGK